MDLSLFLHVFSVWASGVLQKEAIAIISYAAPKMIANLYSMFRQLCSYGLEVLDDEGFYKLGGPGVIVEMDESQFAKKPKHHRGNARDEVIKSFRKLKK
jgi:hypothetical protein